MRDASQNLGLRRSLRCIATTTTVGALGLSAYMGLAGLIDPLDGLSSLASALDAARFGLCYGGAVGLISGVLIVAPR